MSILSKVLRAGEGKKVRRLAEIVPLINDLEDEMVALSDAELAAKSVEFRSRLEEGETLDDLLVEAYAVVREGAKRVLGQRPRPVDGSGARIAEIGLAIGAVQLCVGFAFDTGHGGRRDPRAERC